ncbi:MAG: T9SS type A sorting domain-containing protein, partial [Candidatus Kapabacteria bacterium]|nr:T9SS type A sorting domain-containing protein [Candidatus Kapabacteria bacterium]
QPIYEKLKLAVYDGDTGDIIEVIGSSEFTPGEVSNHNIVLDTEKFYHLKIKSVAVRGDAETESDFSSESVYAYSGNPVSDINETFDNIESLTPMYIKGKWSTTDIKAASLPNSFTDSPTGNYEPNTHDYFILPPMELTAEKSTISFDHIALIDTLVRFNTEGQPSYDYGEIAYSIDFGKTWKFLKWLNFNASENFIMGNIEASQWQSLAYNLSENVGDTVMFKFTFNSNDFRNGEGWFIDNITMDNRPSSVKHELTEMSKVFVSPNPVSSDALVSLKLPVDAVVKIELYNILGSKIESRDLGILNTGEHYIDFNLSTLANGIYYYKVSIGNYTKTVPVSVNR